MGLVKLNNGLEIPQLGFGTWKLLPKINAKQATLAALEVGYRHIDTAKIYGNEKDVGAAIKESGIPRENIFLVTKLWNGDQKNTAQAFEKSLNRLGVDYIDLYLMHFPVTKTRIQAYKDMEKIYKSGRAKSIGVSNFTIAHLEELLEKTNIIPVVNQVEFHPFLYQKDLLDYCKDNGIVLESYSPLAQGKKLNDPVISEIAKSKGASNAQVMIAWNLQLGNIVIPKSKNKDRMRENFDAVNITLTDSEMKTIESLHSNYRSSWDPSDVE